MAPAHAITALALWRLLAPSLATTAHRLACAAHARRAGIEVAGADLQSASEQFRRVRGLRSAGATEAWMASWGVSVEAFTDYLEREALRGLLRDQVPAGTEDDVVWDAPLREALWPDAVFGGEASGWCHRLAARLAVAHERSGEPGLPASLFDPAAAPGLAPDALRVWIDRLDLPHTWFDRLITLESAYARFSETVLTPARMDALMRARWDTLFMLDFEMGRFATEAAAREACLCVTEDGSTIERVCAMAGGKFHQGRVMLGDVPEGMRARALSATSGTLMPVFAWNNDYAVCRVLGKSEPSLDDPKTRAIVSEAVLEDAVRPLVRQHITWAPGIAG